MVDAATVRRVWEKCSWGNRVDSAEDWLGVLNGTDEGARKRLFKRLFLDYPEGACIGELFEKAEIGNYLLEYNRPFPRSHIERRRKVWRYLYCGIREAVPELDWTMRS